MVGIDISDEMLTKARIKSSSIQWYKDDAADLPFNNAEFNGAICILAIHHIDQLMNAFREAFRILKVNGRLIIFTATTEQMDSYWLKYYFAKIIEEACQKMLST